MKKKLIRVDNLDEFICKESGKVHVDGNTILTPGAKDELTKRGIGIVYDRRSRPVGAAPGQPGGKGCPPGCKCPLCTQAKSRAAAVEDLLISVAAVLKKDYGIKDPDELRSKSISVVKSIKESL